MPIFQSRILRSAIFWACVSLAAASWSRYLIAADETSFRDHAGRDHLVTLPVKSVAAAGGPAEILLYSLAPELMVGWNRNPSPAARRFIPESLQPRVQIPSLPDASNAHLDAEFAALQPQLILDYGSMHQDYIDRADVVQERLGIPFMSYDGSLERIPEVYRELGGLLGVQERAETLAQLAEYILARYQSVLAGKAEAQNVYITTSDDGLLAAFTEDTENDIFAWLGVNNAAGSIEGVSQLPINFQQIAEWNPETIFALNPALLGAIENSIQWQALPAVQKGRVYTAPRLPFDWIARPPSVNRLLGLIWVTMVLSPEQTEIDFESDLRRVFSGFFHHELTDSELEALIGI